MTTMLVLYINLVKLSEIKYYITNNLSIPLNEDVSSYLNTDHVEILPSVILIITKYLQEIYK